MESKYEYDVSLIIPTYAVTKKTLNGELAIKFGFESIERQQVEGFKFEVVFVDDNSPDSTSKITQEWAQKSGIPFQQIVRTESSGSPSQPRNEGIKTARGKYIAFMDNDDQLGDRGSLFKLFKKIEEWDSDVIIGQPMKKGKGSLARSPFIHGDFKRVDFYKFNPMANIAVWSRLYRHSFLKEIKATFPTKYGGVQEDFYFNAQVFSQTDKISLLADQVYYWWVDTDEGHLSSEWTASKFKEINSQNAKALLLMLSSDKPFRYQHAAAFLERIMNSGQFKENYRNIKAQDRETMLIKSKNHHTYRKILKKHFDELVEFIPQEKYYQVKSIIESDDIHQVVKDFRAINTYFSPEKYVLTKKFFPTIFEKIKYEGAMFDFGFNKIIRQNIIFNFEKGMYVSNQNLTGKDNVLLVITREKDLLRILPMNEIVELPEMLLLEERTYDFFIGFKISHDEIVAEMACSSFAHLSKTLTYKDGINLNFYKNWKGGISYNVTKRPDNVN
ncbi:glycosyltransferase [Lactococcus formosensis]|uniref:Glycosyltransferase n=1 Tax=Lactococcus formosensis TaxID=1281486 RepID=A0A9X4P5F3_9LACT|nr:glycosyltransferase family 2 protein [Lactococcus formosensis]MDG6142569.1 glycosyltransferase [Lactococcus formosensis]MDG6160004.1 glycosyltransferase [Lactococcus formosensis]MDG6166043.1 glycosyltransferase [Lactococcus formosensis]MDG6172672.1 glycosyltransferase [Lactococcus formosensis]MDG6193436.1 glycosyltransferase [Lactococcus formosensis]